MRLSLTVVDGRNGRAVDSLVDFDTEEPLAELVQPLAGLFGEQVHSSFARRIPMWVDGRAVHGDEAAGAAGVRSGCVVSLFEPFDGLTREMPGGVVELRVVAGPGAGRIHRLPLGETEVGCGASGWSLPDLRMPSNALTVRVGADGDVVVVPAPGLSATLEQEPLEHEVVWPVDAYLFVGDTILARADVELPTAEVRVDEAEALVDFNRPPRLLPPERERRFSLPDKPTDVRRRPFPWVMVFAPMFIAVPMGLIFGPRFLLFALFSPVMAIANFVSDRRTSRKDGVQSQKEYDAELVSVNERIERALLAERAANRISSPDPATLLLHAIGPGGRLWERRVDDPDYLRVRVGLAELPTGITVEEGRSKTEEEPPPRMLAGVPSWLDLSQLGVVGVAGEEETSAPLARWLVAQLALLHSPRDLRVTVLSDAEGEVRWNWVRWLPHARADADHVTIGTQQDSVGRRLAELNALVAARTEQSRDRGRHVPDILVVLDGARRLRALPAVVELLRQGPRVGVMVLCLDDEPRQLPEECRAIVVCEAGRVQIQETAADDTTGVTPDLVELPWCETVARAISSLRDTTPQEESTGIPSSARLLDLIDMDPPTPDAVAALWSRGRRTDVVVGAGYDGPFRLDLRKDGPHALIAGTTGSGKSELLQTMVASLALANRPDEMTFVLVDYKGGSAFKDCARLPHTVGMVTDLDTHLVGRALVSLGAELRRREHLLAVPGAKDLEDYWALQRNQPELPAIPRLALVIDEFASLAAELPDFVQGLVSIAQRGRSLGIHLVLATQRPSGVVSADIRANTNLRISLRVTDENDSRDVLDAPDAARILKSQPGRAYVRTGASTLMPFQSGRVGGRSPGAGPNDRVGPAALAWPIPWDKVGVPAPVRPKDETEQTDESDTDLAAVVDAIEKANTSLSVPPQHSRDLLLGGLLSASLLGALAAERRRRRGSAPDDEALEAEVALRVGADENRAAWLDRSLRGLGAICRTERSALPPVFAVTVDDDEIRLRLAPSRTDAPSPWTAEDDGRVWKLSRDAAEPTELGHAPYPGLVCVGRDTDQRDVLVDLESAGGVVSVSGDDRLAGEVVSALAVQLVTNAWADDQQVTGQDLSPVLADLAGDRLRLVEDVEPLLADVVRTHPDRAAGEVLTGRLARRPGIAPEYVVLGTEPTRELADRLSELTATGSRGFGVVSRGTITGTRWQMHIDETGTLSLPLLDVRVEAVRLTQDVRVEAVRLTQSSAEQVAELLQRARTPRPVTGEGRVGIVAPTRSGDDAHWSAAEARVGVLGTIETRTGGVLDPTRVPLATEMAMFLALQGTAVHPSVLGASIWPRGVTPEVRDATIDRVREWLGSDADGNHYLRADETGRLSLGPGVAVDWDAFCELAIRAQRSPSPREEAELLRRALHLVRGEFLDGRPTNRYSWIARTNLETHVPDVVVDAARRLVELCDQDGDPAGASTSGRAGLRLAPDSQLLWRAVVRSEYEHGGVEAAAAAVREMADVLTERGADIEAETEALVAELLPTREQAAN